MVNKELDMDVWLDGDVPADLPRYARKAIEQELSGRLETLWSEADSDFDMWCVKYIAKNWDLVLDMLTVQTMNGVYGRNQEERIATHLTVKCFADGSLKAEGFGNMYAEAVYNKLDVLLSRCRTNVLPLEVHP